MRSALNILAALVVATLVWFGVWFYLMGEHVARVEASLHYHNERMREARPTVNLKFDSVHATGFPLRMEIAVDRPTLSMVDGTESFAVSFERVTLAPAGEGTYQVNLPPRIESIYAKDGAAPEHYSAVVDMIPGVMLSTREAGLGCGPLVGTTCTPLSPDAPLISYSLDLPPAITLTMSLGSESKAANFVMPPLDFPVFMSIPEDMRRPLQLFVAIQRETLVFGTSPEAKP